MLLLAMMAHVSNAKTQEVDTEGSRIQGQTFQMTCQFKAILCLDLFSNKQINGKQRVKHPVHLCHPKSRGRDRRNKASSRTNLFYIVGSS